MEEQANKRIIGQIVETEEVKPRKRIRLAIEPTCAEKIDYEKSFKSLYRIILENDALYGIGKVCDICYTVTDRNDGFMGWEYCEACGDYICPDCLPNHEPDDVTRINIFYCPKCIDKLRKDTLDEEPGYTNMTITIGGIASLLNTNQ